MQLYGWRKLLLLATAALAGPPPPTVALFADNPGWTDFGTTRAGLLAPLGSYAGGFNADKARLQPFLPSIITVPRSGAGSKTMTWPMAIGDDATLPDSNIVKSRVAQQVTVACLTFPVAATGDAVSYFASELEKQLAADGLSPAPGYDANWVVAQYDAIFSVGDRRNEIWIPLAPGHLWD